MSPAKIDKYARMADQIGDYFAALPRAEAAAGVALHISRFWTPKMIADIMSAIAMGKVTLSETAADGFAILSRDLASAG